MAYKTLFLVLLVAFSVHAEEPEEPCLCVKDEASVWKFLETLSVDVPEEERSVYAVFPGELSPLVSCDCESERRKRKILDSDNAPEKVDSSVEVAPPEVDSELTNSDEKVRARKSLQRGSCPEGKVKFGRFCVDEDSIDY